MTPEEQFALARSIPAEDRSMALLWLTLHVLNIAEEMEAWAEQMKPRYDGLAVERVRTYAQRLKNSVEVARP